MGGNESSGQNKKLEAIRDQYMFFKEITDPVLGEIKILKHKTSGQTIGNKNIQSEQNIDWEEFEKKFYSRAQLSNQHLATLKQMMQREEEAMCGSFELVDIYFEYYDNNLRNDIAHRQQNDNYYTVEELWNIVDSLVDACSYLQQHEIPHQDISPENIMIDPHGCLKIGDYGLIVRGFTGYYRQFLQKSDNCYLSPELVQKLRDKQINPMVDFYKSDVFSMGMIVLNAATLKNVNNCYNLKQGVLNNEALDQTLHQVKQRYGVNLEQYLRNYILVNENSRCNWLALRLKRPIQSSPMKNVETHVQVHNPSPERQEVKARYSPYQGQQQTYSHSPKTELTTNVEQHENSPQLQQGVKQQVHQPQPYQQQLYTSYQSPYLQNYQLYQGYQPQYQYGPGPQYQQFQRFQPLVYQQQVQPVQQVTEHHEQNQPQVEGGEHVEHEPEVQVNSKHGNAPVENQAHIQPQQVLQQQTYSHVQDYLKNYQPYVQSQSYQPVYQSYAPNIYQPQQQIQHNIQQPVQHVQPNPEQIITSYQQKYGFNPNVNKVQTSPHVPQQQVHQVNEIPSPSFTQQVHTTQPQIQHIDSPQEGKIIYLFVQFFQYLLNWLSHKIMQFINLNSNHQISTFNKAIQMQKLLQNNIRMLVFIQDKNKMAFVMGKENSAMLMEGFMMEIESMEQWMATEDCIIQMNSLHMREIGKTMHFLEKVLFIMKIQFHLTTHLISQISIFFKNIGRSTKESSKTISKKDSAHFIL